jgi:hypothetical protein
MLREEELHRTGFSSDGQAILVDLERMFKAIPSWAFETAADREAARENRRIVRMARGNPRGMTRIKRDLDIMTKALPTPAPRHRAEVAAAPTDADLVAKAYHHLQFNDGLNAAERGSLMLGISAAHDRGFAKAERHPVAAQVEQVRTSLERAQRERDLGPAGPFVEEALRHIRNGIVDADDRSRLEGLLLQIRTALAAGDTDALGTGDAR